MSQLSSTSSQSSVYNRIFVVDIVTAMIAETVIASGREAQLSAMKNMVLLYHDTDNFSRKSADIPREKKADTLPEKTQGMVAVRMAWLSSIDQIII